MRGRKGWSLGLSVVVNETFTEGLEESEILRVCVCVCVCVFNLVLRQHLVVPWSTLIMVHRSEFSIWEASWYMGFQCEIVKRIFRCLVAQ